MLIYMQIFNLECVMRVIFSIGKHVETGKEGLVDKVLSVSVRGKKVVGKIPDDVALLILRRLVKGRDSMKPEHRKSNIFWKAVQALLLLSGPTE